MELMPTQMVPVFVGGEIKRWACPRAVGTTVAVPVPRERLPDVPSLLNDKLAPTAPMQTIVCRLGCIGWTSDRRRRATYYAYVDDREPDKWLYRGFLTAVWALSALTGGA